MCLFPSYLRPGSDYNVSVTVFQASNPVFIEVAITGSNEIYTNSALANAKGSLQSMYGTYVHVAQSNGI